MKNFSPLPACLRPAVRAKGWSMVVPMIWVVPLLTLGCQVGSWTPPPDQPRESARAGAKTGAKLPLEPREAARQSVQRHAEQRYQQLLTALSASVDSSSGDRLERWLVQAGYPPYANPVATESGPPGLNNGWWQELEELHRGWEMLELAMSRVDHLLGTPSDPRHTAALRRRSVNALTVETVRHYWQALSRDQLNPLFDPVMAEAQNALFISSLPQNSPNSPVLDQMRTLWQQRQNLDRGREKLFSQLGLAPTSAIAWGTATEENAATPVTTLPAATLERYALLNRPETTDAALPPLLPEEVRQALMKLAPDMGSILQRTGSAPSPGQNATIARAAKRLGEHLVDWFASPTARQAAANAPEELRRTRRLALGMAAALQVHAVLAAYQIAGQIHEEARGTAASLEQKQRPPEGAPAASVQIMGGQDALRDRSGLIQARVRTSLAYAERQAAWFRLLISLGLDPLSPKITRDDPAALAKELVSGPPPALTAAPPPPAAPEGAEDAAAADGPEMAGEPSSNQPSDAGPLGGQPGHLATESREAGFEPHAAELVQTEFPSQGANAWSAVRSLFGGQSAEPPPPTRGGPPAATRPPVVAQANPQPAPIPANRAYLNFSNSARAPAAPPSTSGSNYLNFTRP